MKIFYILIISTFLFLSNISYALEAGKWLFVEEDEYCYIGSLPVKTDLSKDKKRGDTYILVYKMIGDSNNIIQIEAGYDYKMNNKITVKIDNAEYEFYTTQDVADSAWTDDDSKVINAMKKGLKLVVTGKSKRGTITNDEYTLKGFTLAINQLNDNCSPERN